MRIAIIDDMERERQRLAGMVEEWLGENGLAGTVACFNGPEEFLRGFEPGAWDLLFVDIYMGGPTGMELARTVRGLDPYVRLVFSTVTSSFAVAGYDVQASGYLVKPVEYGKVAEVLRSALNQRLSDSRFIELRVHRRDCQVLLRCILYAAKQVNTMRVVTEGEVLPVYASYAEFAPRLLFDPRFLECYHGCVVNMEHIVRLSDKGFAMDNGDVLSLRKKSLPAIRAAWLSFEANRMRGDGG